MGGGTGGTRYPQLGAYGVPGWGPDRAAGVVSGGFGQLNPRHDHTGQFWGGLGTLSLAMNTVWGFRVVLGRFGYPVPHQDGMVRRDFGGLRAAPSFARPVQHCCRAFSGFGPFGNFSMHLLFTQSPRSLLASQSSSPPQARSCHAAAHRQAKLVALVVLGAPPPSFTASWPARRVSAQHR